MGENPYLPEPPADGKHIFNGGYRCVRCGVYNREDSPPFHEPCKGRWAESGKMRYAAEDRWAAEQPAVPDPTVEALLLPEVRRHEPRSGWGMLWCACGEGVENGLTKLAYQCHVVAQLAALLAARAAAPDALRVRVEALAAEIEDPRTQRPGMQRRRIWGDRLRALLEDGAQ